MSSTLEHDPRVIKERAGVAGALADYRRRLREGDIGQLPVVVSIIAIWSFFYLATDGIFLGPFNLVNLTFQMAAVGSISVGVVLILLLGEIDLSAGLVSGACAAVMAVLAVRHGVSPMLAVGLAVLSGSVIGAFQGSWATYFGIPTFVVTLAGQSIWGGVLLLVLGRTGTINLTDPAITGLANTFFNGAPAYAIALAFLAYVAGVPLLDRYRRNAAGLSVSPASAVLGRAVLFAVLILGAVTVLCRDRGISSSLFYLLTLMVVVDVMLRRTRFGRMIYAVGGNAEAARRAGISVMAVRVAVFALASAMAAWGGILSASRLLAVNQSAGQANVLLNAIAAAVIGGTSLLGGRGSVWAALLGIIVVQSISNGMDLMSLQPAIKAIVTGVVLLVTVTLDAVLRRGKAGRGR